MDRADVIKKIKMEKLVAVVRAESKEQGLDIADAVTKGGIKLIEVTMTVPGALDIIRELSEKYKDTDVVIGAGTVLDSQTARMVILAGGEFVVSPMLSEETIRLCNRYSSDTGHYDGKGGCGGIRAWSGYIKDISGQCIFVFYYQRIYRTFAAGVLYAHRRGGY